MTVDRISYKKVFPISSFCTEHIGLEASLSETDNPETELSHLRQMVEELHKVTLAEMDSYRGTSVSVVGEREMHVKKVPDEIADALEGIEKCQTPDELKNWWTLSKSNLKLSVAYKAKEKQLKDVK